MHLSCRGTNLPLKSLLQPLLCKGGVWALCSKSLRLCVDSVYVLTIPLHMTAFKQKMGPEIKTSFWIACVLKAQFLCDYYWLSSNPMWLLISAFWIALLGYSTTCSLSKLGIIWSYEKSVELMRNINEDSWLKYGYTRPCDRCTKHDKYEKKYFLGNKSPLISSNLGAFQGNSTKKSMVLFL